jgi:hypothetical protein
MLLFCSLDLILDPMRQQVSIYVGWNSYGLLWANRFIFMSAGLHMKCSEPTVFLFMLVKFHMKCFEPISWLRIALFAKTENTRTLRKFLKEKYSFLSQKAFPNFKIRFFWNMALSKWAFGPRRFEVTYVYKRLGHFNPWTWRHYVPLIFLEDITPPTQHHFPEEGNPHVTHC